MKSQINVEKSHVLDAQLPNHGSTYTVISHKFVIDTTKQMLANGGFIITNEFYRANGQGQVAQGIYHIRPININDDNDLANEKELGMMFAWTNSYDKSVRFQCALGAYVMACSNGMVCGELNYARKHTGNADQEVKSQISSQIKNAQKAFDRIRKDRDALKTITLSEKNQAELLGRMFFNENLISARQMKTVKDEMEKSSFDYQVDKNNAWAFYNHITHSYKAVHPRTWLSDTKNFHDFITANVLNGIGIINTDIINTNNVINSKEEQEDIIDLNIPAEEHILYPEEHINEIDSDLHKSIMQNEELKADQEMQEMKAEKIISDEEAEDLIADQNLIDKIRASEVAETETETQLNDKVDNTINNIKNDEEIIQDQVDDEEIIDESFDFEI